MSDNNARWYIGKFSATNRAHWIEDFTVTDTDGTAIDLTSATFSLGVFDPSSGSQVLTGSLDDSVFELVPADDNNQFRWTFTDTDMRGLDPGRYNIGITITIASVVTQIMTGELLVYDGFVP